MSSVVSGWNTKKVILRVFAAMILYVCISTVADTVPMSESPYHGLDVLTISGDRSSVEVFSVGGVIVLHDYSVIVPGCEFCTSLRFQVDHSPLVSAQSPELSTRSMPTALVMAESDGVRQRTYHPQLFELASWEDDLDIPPPRS